MAIEDETTKDFVCRQCSAFLDSDDLIDGNCPNCHTDEDIYMNDLNEEHQ